jgi:hypothetical protein
LKPVGEPYDSTVAYIEPTTSLTDEFTEPLIASDVSGH